MQPDATQDVNPSGRNPGKHAVQIFLFASYFAQLIGVQAKLLKTNPVGHVELMHVLFGRRVNPAMHDVQSRLLNVLQLVAAHTLLVCRVNPGKQAVQEGELRKV